MNEIEIINIKRKYEAFRLKDKNREKYLLSSIQEYGIKEPLCCSINGEGDYVLLDGYKRLRCAEKLKISLLPVSRVGTDEADSILHLIRLSNEKTLSILEQASFVNELKKQFGLTVSDIAKELERSSAWVSVRLSIFKEMSESIKEAVFSGRFPVRSYMYTLRQFTRVMKNVGGEAERFVKALAGKGLSLRQIDALAYAYFRGSDEIKKQIEGGNLSALLKKFKEGEATLKAGSPLLSAEENNFIHTLQLFQKYMFRFLDSFGICKGGREEFRNPVALLAGGILARIDEVKQELGTLI